MEGPGKRAERPSIEGVGLSLSGGGVSGFGSTCGFLVAWDLALASHSVTDLAQFSGVSVGGILSSLVAGGVPPVVIAASQWHRRAVDPAYRPLTLGDTYPVAWGDILATPLRLIRALARRVVGLSGGRVLPRALLSSHRIGERVRETLEHVASDDFRLLGRRLTITFHDLLTCRRVVCGYGGHQGVPISEAVRASLAVPGIYQPQRLVIDGRPHLAVDGGTAGVSLDVDGASGLDVLLAFNNSGYEPIADRVVSGVEALELSVKLLFAQRNAQAVLDAMNRVQDRHIILFEAPPSNPSGFLSARSAYASYEPTLRATTREIALQLPYLRALLEPRGVVLNPEIGDLDIARAIDDPIGVKEELRARYAPDAPPLLPLVRRGRPGAPVAIAPPVPGRIRVLAVDDEPDVLESIEDLLEGAPVELSVADGPRGARALLERARFDVLLLDLQMPDGGGERLLAQAKAIDPLVEVCIVTAHGSERKAVELLKEAGASYYLTKTELDPGRLLEVIEEAALHREAQRIARDGGFEVLRREAEGGVPRLVLAGHLVADVGFSRARALADAVEAEVERGARGVVLDARWLRALVPLAIARLIPLAETLTARGGTLVLAGFQGLPDALVELADRSALRVEPTLERALGAVAARATDALAARAAAATTRG